MITRHRDYPALAVAIEQRLWTELLDEGTERILRYRLDALLYHRATFEQLTAELDARGVRWRAIDADDPDQAQ